MIGEGEMAIISVLFDGGQRRDFEVPDDIAVRLVDKFDEMAKN